MRSQSTSHRSLRAVTFVLLIAAGAAPRAQTPVPPQPPVRAPQTLVDTRADLVLVDVTVLDRDSNPIPDLTAADFELIVNGKPRPINTVQYLPTIGAKSTSEDNPRLADVSSNDGRSTGRLLLFAIDENHLRAGGGRAVLRTAEELMNALAPGDLIGLARLPTGVGGVEFTTDRNRVRSALRQVNGNQPSTNSSVRLSEAWAFETNDQFTWSQVIERDCGNEEGFSKQACVSGLEAEAKGLVADAQARGMMSVRALETLMRSLTRVNAPITIILISEGMFLAREQSVLADFGKLAAAARATIHVVQPGRSLFDENKAEVLGGGLRDDDLNGEGLGRVAGETRGTLHRVQSNSGAGVFQRISRELSGYYLLSFEPTEADRTVRNPKVDVQVKRRGVTVRSRSTYSIADAKTALTADAPPERRVSDMLTAPLPTPGLPLRVATYTVANAQDARVRVVVSAEVGDPATEPAEMTVGLLVFDKNEKFLVNSIGPSKLAPASARTPTPRLFLSSVALEPGEYTLRLAVTTADGRSGSVHHTINARLDSIAGDVKASDLMLAAEPGTGGEAPRPAPSALVDTETVSAILELTADETARLGKTTVTVEVADNPTGPALIQMTAQSTARADGKQRQFVAPLELGVLPEGEYVARAVIKVPGANDTHITRRFRLGKLAGLAPVAVPGGPVDPDEAPAPLPVSRIIAPVPKFATEDVLRADVVRPFIDTLLKELKLSESSIAVLQKAREGRFEAPPADARTAGGDEPALAFVRGLAALQKKELAQAIAWFQLTLRGASDFLGAAFYLGATHAATGRDRDAVGAWQMSLIAEGGERAYPVLVDALLRVGDAQGALDLIAEAPNAWPTDEARWRRVAIAQAMLGQFQPAMEMLNPLLAKQPDDTDLQFVAIQVLYRQHAVTPLLAPDIERFRTYADRYVKARGPQAALVETWRRAVLR